MDYEGLAYGSVLHESLDSKQYCLSWKVEGLHAPGKSFDHTENPKPLTLNPKPLLLASEVRHAKRTTVGRVMSYL